MSSNSAEKLSHATTTMKSQLYFIVYGFAFIFYTGVNRNDTKGIIYGLENIEFF